MYTTSVEAVCVTKAWCSTDFAEPFSAVEAKSTIDTAALGSIIVKNSCQVLKATSPDTCGAMCRYIDESGVGTWAWGNKLVWGYNERMDPELQEAFNLCVSEGINWFDTADSYG